jgi:hypothetical protein
MWPSSSTTHHRETRQAPRPSSRSKRWLELSARLQIVVALAEKCTQGSRRLNVMLGLPERLITAETSSTWLARRSSSCEPSSDTEATERSDELYPCGEIQAKESQS